MTPLTPTRAPSPYGIKQGFDMLIRLSDNQYPVSEYTVIAQNPNTSFPTDFSSIDWSDYGYAYVYSTSPPAGINTQTTAVREAQPALRDDGAYQQVWETYDLPPDVVAANEQAARDAEAEKIRSIRNSRLYATDWTQGRDIPEAVSLAWAPYRQALRDVPDQAGFPWEVVWPTEP